jgi:hypothetical protein
MPGLPISPVRGTALRAILPGPCTEIGVAAASVDTGIANVPSTRAGLLHADKFPHITVTLERPAAVRTDGTRGVAFARPVPSLLGKTQA